MDRKNERTKPEKMLLNPIDPENKRPKHVAKAGRRRENFCQKGRCVAHLNMKGFEIHAFLQKLMAMIHQH